jgi:small subunit ribosomal protein S19
MTRSIRKGPFVDPTLLKQVKKIKETGQKKVIKTWKRGSMVIPDLVGLTVAVHDGRKFISVFITENMVGHSLGEFAPTRTFRVHSGQRKAGMEAAASTPGAPSAAPGAAPTATPAAAPAPSKSSPAKS